MRPAAAVFTAVLAFLGLLPYESVLVVVTIVGSASGLVALAISAHALRLVRDMQDAQAERIQALDDGPD